uniref:Uncharacterized protein n=1 Tax=Ganoderma leucocontextum TaxID=1566825 RepID=A0A2S1WBF6_9APHY|nr:hypothetical protein [Ganoderma leucocontextum]AWJ63928.1 hypothetical protein [Ganoderma leucocontextum]
MLQLYYFIKDEASFTPVERRNLLINTELLTYRVSGGKLLINNRLNLFDQLNGLVTTHLSTNNLLVESNDGSISTTSPVIIVDGFGFKVIVSAYNESVWDRVVSINKFAVCDSDSQLITYLNRSKSEWLQEWRLYSLNPLTNTLIRNDATIFCDTVFTGISHFYAGIRFNRDLGIRMGQVLNLNQGIDSSLPNVYLYHPCELEMSKKKRTVLILGNYTYYSRLEITINRFMERNRGPY